MKKYLIFAISSLFFIVSCSNKFILKRTYSTGLENISSSVNEYNTKQKTITVTTQDSTKISNLALKRKDYNYFKNTLKNAGINSNFCWISKENYPEYSNKYEIIFNEKEANPNCQTEPVKYEVYDSFVQITDSIRKISALR